MKAEPTELRWECAECESIVEQIPCPCCGCPEILSVWSDGERVDALVQSQSGDSR
jgi:hypothetical protein